MKIFFSNILLFCMSLSDQIAAQTTGNRTVSIILPVVTLMDIEPPGNINMNFTAPTEAGRPVIPPAANSTKWINYSSAIASGGSSRRITAAINQTIPGVSIRLQTATASGSGGGTLGIPAQTITLTTTPTTIISGIGGAFTGTGTNNGHRLTLTLVTTAYANLFAISNIPIVITYTITE